MVYGGHAPTLSLTTITLTQPNSLLTSFISTEISYSITIFYFIILFLFFVLQIEI